MNKEISAYITIEYYSHVKRDHAVCCNMDKIEEYHAKQNNSKGGKILNDLIEYKLKKQPNRMGLE